MGVALAKVLDNAAIVILHHELGHHTPRVPQEMTKLLFCIGEKSKEKLWTIQDSRQFSELEAAVRTTSARRRS